MNNLNALLIGQTGSGKTSFAKYLLGRTPRAFVFDPRDDYDSAPPFYEFKPALDFYARHHRRPFHLIYRGDPKTFVAWLDILFRVQRMHNDPPLGVFLEESSLYSSSHVIDQYLERIYTQGRRQRINIVTVTQRDTQIHPIIRANSHVWISLRQRKFSSDVKQVFTSDDLDKLPQLKTFTPMSGAPIEGVHYLSDIPDFPLVERWSSLLQEDPRPSV